jgi:putative ABC transport system permease protein
MLRSLRVASFLAFQSLKRGNKATIALTILIVSLAFVNLIFISSILGGLVEAINNQIVNNMVSNIIISPQEEPTKKDFIVHPEELQRQIENIPGVIATAKRYKLAGTIAYDKDRRGEFKSVSGEIIGIDPEEEKQVTPISQKVVDGRYLESPGKGEILLGLDLAGSSGAITELNSLGGAKVGDEVRVTFSNGIVREYKVKGIFRTQFDIVDGMAFITVSEAESALSVQRRASQILVRIDKTGTEDYYIPQIQSLASNLEVRKWTDYFGALGGISSSLGMVSSIVSVIGLAVAVITLFIIIYVNVVNRRRQIGILKAIGIKQDIIVYSYILQALFYSISGVIIAALSIFYLIAPYLVAHPWNMPMAGNVSLALDRLQVVYSAASLLVVGFVAGLIPSWRVARENILKAIWGT